jgi:hypothetical protein
MKKKLLIWWIDDDPKRFKGSARQRIENPSHPALKGRRAARLEFKEVATDDQSIELYNELLQAKRSKALPNLAIIDQILNRKEGGLRRGSTIAVSFRAEAPTLPAVGVTAADLSEIAELQKDQFIEFFCINDLQSGKRVPELFAIADGFSRLIASKPRSESILKRRRAILDLLDCPKEDRDFLSTCLPGEFIEVWDDETPHALARWIWQTFVGRAGFLYDDLELATLVGLRETGLELIAQHLEGCEYKGVFASPARRRWWVSKIRNKIRAETAAVVTDPLWQLGRKLVGDRNGRYFSRCHGIKQKCVPDVVAFEDGLRRQRVQARSDDTEVLKSDTSPIGFEQHRVFCRK